MNMKMKNNSLKSEKNYVLSVSKSIKHIIDTRFNGVVLQFAEAIGEDRKRLDYIIGGNQVKGPGVDIIGKILDTFPDISARSFFNYEFPMSVPESNIVSEPVTEYVKNNSPTPSDEIIRLQAQLEYMTKLYEHTLRELISIQIKR